MILESWGAGAPISLRRPGPPSGPRPARSAPTPFSHAALASLRLLSGYVLVADEARSGRCALLRLAGVERLPFCAALPRVVVAARRQPRMAWTLDGILAGVVGDRAEALGRASVADLAWSWRRDGASLEGLDLLARVWWLARDPRVAVRPLERRIAAEVDPSRLLSRVQRAHLHGLRPQGEES